MSPLTHAQAEFLKTCIRSSDRDVIKAAFLLRNDLAQKGNLTTRERALLETVDRVAG